MKTLDAIEAIESQLRPILTVNLFKLLVETDKRIAESKIIAAQTGDYTDVQASNCVRTAILNIVDERDSSLVDEYLHTNSI